MRFTREQHYLWLAQQLNGKRDWLRRFSSGRDKWPDHEIEKKREDEEYIIDLMDGLKRAMEKEGKAA